MGVGHRQQKRPGEDAQNNIKEPLINSESFSCAGKMPERRHFNQQMLIHELIRGSLIYSSGQVLVRASALE